MNWKTCYRIYIKELERAIEKHYGQRLVSLVLYGSVARGDHRLDSDVDILIILEDPPPGWGERKDEFFPVTERMKALARQFEDAGCFPHLSYLILSPDEAFRTRPLYLDLTEDARILFDKGRYFSNILRRLRKRMKELGSQRVYVGDKWYWDLKPDMKFGEVIEL
jgi:predicted nucleotidyltransferase